jgi:hypothetical protein
MNTGLGCRPSNGSDVGRQKFPFISGTTVSGLLAGRPVWADCGRSESSQSATSCSAIVINPFLFVTDTAGKNKLESLFLAGLFNLVQ